MTTPPRPGVAFWPVNPECPAPKHNTLRASKGRDGSTGEKLPPCVCAHAVEVLAADKRKRAEANRRPDIDRGRNTAEKRAASRAIANMPDSMRQGGCVKPYGVKTMDRYQDRPNDGATVAEAKALCDSCPAWDDCLMYIRNAERPAGTWHGMYAGMTPAERRLAGRDPRWSSAQA